MINKKDYQNIFFIDVQVVPYYKTFDEFRKNNRNLSNIFIEKFSEYNTDNLSYEELYEKKVCYYAEMSKIAMITFGRVKYDYAKCEYIRFVKNIYYPSEEQILKGFLDVLKKVSDDYVDVKLCGHGLEKNILPYLVKRLILNNIKVPSKLNIASLKPWEVPVLDIQKIWDLTSKNVSSLQLIHTAMFNNDTSENLNGDIVDLLYSEGDNKKNKILALGKAHVNALIDILIKLEGTYE